MTILQAIILGLVQGLCEFLPVSSSGHLVLLQNVFGIQADAIFFDVMLHIGTLIAVLFAFRTTIGKMLRNPLNKYPVYIVLATIPTVIIALLLGDWIESMFSGAFLGFAFLITALVLFTSTRIAQQQKTIRDMTPLEAIAIGTAQGIAIVPGISRSGSTIAAGLFVGLEPAFAAEFSFLMSIPAILGSLVLQVLKIAKGDLAIGSIPIAPTIVGTIVAAISGLFAIQVMMRVIKKGKLAYFAIYVAVLGVLVLIDQNFTHFFL